MSDMFLGSQLPIYQNVRIRTINQITGETTNERVVKNRVTRLMLWGIARFLAGEFNGSTPDKIYEYIPRYLALGSNKPSTDNPTSSVTTNVTVNDTRLLNEYTIISSSGKSEPVKRVSIQGRQHTKTSTSFSDAFIKLSFSAYISSKQFDQLEIAEAGLFSKEYDNNCLARVVFAPITKQEHEVIDIQWDITLLSYGMTKYPRSVSIDGPSKITIPITYTTYHIADKFTGLFYDQVAGVLYDEDGNNIFFIDSDGAVHVNRLQNEMVNSTWDKYLKTQGDSNLTLDRIYNVMSSAVLHYMQFKFKDSLKATHFYLGESRRTVGRDNLLADSEGYLLQDSEKYQLVTADPVRRTSYAQAVMMSYIYRESENFDYTDTGYRIQLNDTNEYKIVTSTGEETNYKIIDNQFYVKLGEEFSPMDAYIHKGCIIHKNRVSTDYIYDIASGKISQKIAKVVADYTVTEMIQGITSNLSVKLRDTDTDIQYYSVAVSGSNISELIAIDNSCTVASQMLESNLVTITFFDENGDFVYAASLNNDNTCSIVGNRDVRTNAYLAWNDDATRFNIWKVNNYLQLENTGYYIDEANDREVYRNDVDTEYHITTDDYFALGDTYKLTPVISPSDATDKSVSWSVINSIISKINDDGVLTGWNVGETTAIVTTTNGIKSRIAVEVVKNVSMIDAESIILTPSTLVFKLVDSEANNEIKYVDAVVEPAYAANNIVDWSLEADGQQICTITAVGNNRVKVTTNNTGNIGKGYITATVQGNLSATCLVEVNYSTAKDDPDCPDPSHNNQNA